jgi:hypothetical protein
MFPFVRIIKDMIRASRMPRLAGVTDTHVSHHICWPHDLDFWLELNNGRALSLYDIGRIGLAQRIGLLGAIRREKWGLTMAGSCTRFRRRIHGFERFEMRSHAVCWDDRFTYIEQSMWKRNGECASQVVYRAAVTDKNGIVGTDRVQAALGHKDPSPPMPEWIAAWCKTEDVRPWPPLDAP